jgi:hypothetical protein
LCSFAFQISNPDRPQWGEILRERIGGLKLEDLTARRVPEILRRRDSRFGWPRPARLSDLLSRLSQNY